MCALFLFLEFWNLEFVFWNFQKIGEKFNLCVINKSSVEVFGLILWTINHQLWTKIMKEQNKYLILIHKRLSNQLTSDEVQMLDTWLEADPKYRALYETTAISWNKSQHYKADYQPDTANEWSKLNDKINTEKVVSMPSRRRWWVAAAAVLLLAGGAFWWFNNALSPTEKWVEIHSNDSLKDVKLPDGSTVTLNKNTTLAYLEDFNTNESRTVKMTGEAFFQVVRITKPFIVQTKRADVRVLGTSFNVKSDIEATQVTVASGKVAVSSKVNPQRVTLKRGEKATATKAGTLEKSIAKTFNDLAWKTRRLDFDATPLNEVFANLESFFNIKIDATQLKENCTYTGDVVEGDKIEDILKGLEKIHNIKINKTSKGYQVTGGNC